MWPEQEDCARVFSHVKLVARHWISCRSTAGEEAIEQHVLYNLVEGALLVDGRPIGSYSLQLIQGDAFRDGLRWDLPGPFLNLRNGEVLITKNHQP